MSPKIPLYSLSFFEAAARHSSFLKAAEELNITPAAVAHQVRRLEASLETPLFERLPKGVLLNPAGAAFLKVIQRSLDEIEQGAQMIRGQKTETVVRIVALHGFIERWLFPRLKRFSAQNSHIRIELRASEKPVQFRKTNEDIWISHEQRSVRGEGDDLLFSTRMAPVCSPDHLQANRSEGLDLLNGSTQLYDTFWVNDWGIWLKNHAGELCPDSGRSLGFDLYNMVIQAAIDGMGLAMGHDRLITSEIDSGKLIYPFSEFCDCPNGFYLNVNPSGRSEGALTFMHWIKEEAKRE